MEKGFFHPDLGYWQTVSEPTAETLAAYPAGTVEVPLKPGANFDWVDGEWVAIAPPPASVPNLSFAQLMIGLVSEGWITNTEGEAWLTGTLPAPVLTLIATLPEAQRFAAKARALRPTVVERTDPLVSDLGAAQGKTDAQLDTFFQTYAAI